jgi:hypothetical protein
MRVVHVAALMLYLGLTSTAAAQQPVAPTPQGQKPAAPRPAAKVFRPRWTVEVYGGWSGGSTPTGGAAKDAFPAGAPFTTEAGTPSRAHSSWYFGDGARLFNEVAASFTQINGRPLARLVPLDTALHSAALGQESAPLFGARVGRVLTSRLRVEVLFERGGSVSPTGAFQEAVSRSSDAFRVAFTGLLGTAPVTGLAVTSTAEQPSASNGQVRILGSLTWMVAERGRLGLHVTGGGGVALRTGTQPELRIAGDYQFSLYGTSPMHESDRLVIRLDEPDRAPIGLAGGALTYRLSRRTSVRADVRVLVGANRATTTLQASPAKTASTLPAVLPSVTSPAIQFSTKTSAPSSLSGPALDLVVFQASGVAARMQGTIGFVMHF